MRNLISIRLLYLLTIISYWGLIAIIAIVIFAGIIMLTLDPELMKLGFPSNISHIEEVVYLKADVSTPIQVEFSAGSIDIPVKYLDKLTMSYVLFMSLMWLSCLTVIARYFKTFMGKVLDGQIFHSESIFLLKKAALGLVVLEVIELITETIGHYFIERNFDLGGLENKFSWPFPSTALILALTLWVLAHIFQIGKELEDEQKLTV